MKTVAVIFSHSPHGNTLGQEGLDLAISLTSYTKKIGIFFFNDGVFQFLKKQKTTEYNFFNYSNRFEMLIFLGVKKFYCDKTSLNKRGLFGKNNFFLN